MPSSTNDTSDETQVTSSLSGWEGRSGEPQQRARPPTPGLKGKVTVTVENVGHDVS